MRFRIHSIALAAVAALGATAIQIGSILPALAHSLNTHTIYVGHHHMPVKQPPPVQATNTINVRDYGATGNGVIDDGPAIQNAINAAIASGAGVFFPAGTYLHAEPLTFAGLAVTGVGPTSTLLAANTGAVVTLTGFGPSIQNMQISTQGLTGSGTSAITLYVVNATSFTVSNNTFSGGIGFYNLEVVFSSIGAINSNTFNGPGGRNSAGVYLNYVLNCSVNSNLFQNQGNAIYVYDFSQFIAVQNNVMGNVTYPCQQEGVYIDLYCNYVTVSGNTIQLANSTTQCYGIVIYSDYNTNIFVTQNQIWGGWNGIYDYDPYTPGSHFIEQNTIRNCGSSGIYLNNVNVAGTTLMNNNVFGECGLLDTTSTSAVIYATGTAALLANTQFMNNAYQGHANNLQYYVYAPLVPGLNISGNTQSQTSLPGDPNN